MVIGLMLLHIDSFTAPDPFSSIVAAGVAAGASKEGFNVMLYTAVAEEEGDRAASKINRQIDGLVLVLPPRNSPIVEECLRQRIPVVSVLQEANGTSPTVNSSDYEGAKLATQHLLDFGHRRIAHLAGAPSIHTSQLRIDGYSDTLIYAGIPVHSEWLKEGEFLRQTGYESTKELLRLPETIRPTAIFAANDLSAHGALGAVHELGLRVPEDISIVGYDDTWYASILSPQLTSVNINVDLIGRRAVEMLIQTIEGEPQPLELILPVNLSVRGSTGPAPTAQSEIISWKLQ